MVETRLPLPEKANDEGKKNIIAQVYYLDASIERCWVEGGELIVQIDADAGSAPDLAGLEARIEELFAAVEKSFKKTNFPILEESPGTGTCEEDPFPALQQSRQVIPHMPGVAVYQGDLLRLLRGFDAHFRDYALSLESLEQEYPTTVPLASLVANGYVASFPQHALFVSAAHADVESIHRVEAAAKQAEGLPDFRQDQDQANQVLAPTVCYHCFEALRGQSVPAEGRLFTAHARCHRHEYRTVYGLERLQTFSMREIIAYGGEEFVMERLDEILQHTVDTFRDWGLRFRVIGASDPFFAIEASKKRTFQSLLRLKRELQLYLPYRDEWLAVASFNNHIDTLVSAYDIGRVGGDARSGCVGWGYERVASGLLAQHGTDPAAWPAPVQALLEN